MGTGHSQKGFFIVAILLVGVALIASYFNAGAEGNVVIKRPDAFQYFSPSDEDSRNQQGPLFQSCESLSRECNDHNHYSLHNGDRGDDEETAIANAIKLCEKEVEEYEKLRDKCLVGLSKSLLACNIRPDCNVVDEKNLDTLNKNACHVFMCRYFTTFREVQTECTYIYKNGKRVEPGECETDDGEYDEYPVDDGWYCSTTDGGYNYGFTCIPE